MYLQSLGDRYSDNYNQGFKVFFSSSQVFCSVTVNLLHLQTRLKLDFSIILHAVRWSLGVGHISIRYFIH